MTTQLKEYLKNVSLAYLARYSCSEDKFKLYLEKKAKKRLAIDKLPEEVKNLIEEIKNLYVSKNYINNTRYAQMEARRLFKRGKSLVQIKITLKQKGVNSADGIEGLEEEYNKSQDDLELQAAMVFAKKRKLGIYRVNKDEEYTADLRRKDLSKILQAGFSYDIAKLIIGVNRVLSDDGFSE